GEGGGRTRERWGRGEGGTGPWADRRGAAAVLAVGDRRCPPRGGGGASRRAQRALRDADGPRGRRRRARARRADGSHHERAGRAGPWCPVALAVVAAGPDRAGERDDVRLRLLSRGDLPPAARTRRPLRQQRR